jgi:hypothetical protein
LDAHRTSSNATFFLAVGSFVVFACNSEGFRYNMRLGATFTPKLVSPPQIARECFRRKVEIDPSSVLMYAVPGQEQIPVGKDWNADLLAGCLRKGVLNLELANEQAIEQKKSQPTTPPLKTKLVFVGWTKQIPNVWHDAPLASTSPREIRQLAATFLQDEEFEALNLFFVLKSSGERKPVYGASFDVEKIYKDFVTETRGSTKYAMIMVMKPRPDD